MDEIDTISLNVKAGRRGGKSCGFTETRSRTPKAERAREHAEEREDTL